MQYSVVHFFIIETVFLTTSLLKNKKIKSWLFFLLIVFYSSFIGYRNENIGIDTKAYIIEYLSGTGGYFSEKGFTFIGKYLYKWGFGWQSYFTFLSILSLSNYCLGYKLNIKKEKNYSLICWIFFFNITALYGNVNGIRQFIAGSFLLLSISFLKKEKNIWSYLFFAIGISFHKSLIIFIFLYVKWFWKIFKKLNNNQKRLVIFICIVLSFFLEHLLLLNHQVEDYSQKYFNKTFYIKYIFLLLTYLFYQKNKNKEKFIEYVFFYTFLIISLFINFEHLSNRFIYYINIFTPILFYQMFDKKDKIINKKTLVLIVFIYHILILFYPSTKAMFCF